MTEKLFSLFKTSGIFHLTPGMLVMWVIACTLIYLAIAKDYEPLLLLPIGFGIIVGNIPSVTGMDLSVYGENTVLIFGLERCFYYGNEPFKKEMPFFVL